MQRLNTRDNDVTSGRRTRGKRSDYETLLSPFRPGTTAMNNKKRSTERRESETKVSA